MIGKVHFLRLFRAMTVVFLFIVTLPAYAIDIREVTSPGGIKAWLVEDYTLPIIAVSFSFDGGATQDEAGKEGTAQMLASLLDEGAGDMDSETFRAALEEFGISMGFSASRDRFSGSLRMVREDMDRAFSMLSTALNEPLFEDEAIERMRNAIRTGIVRSRTNPSAVSSAALRKTLFQEHFYARPVQGDEASIDAITREDILAMHKRLLSGERVTVGVVGAINEDELGQYLDATFGRLSPATELAPVTDVVPELGKSEQIDMAVPNASITLVYKGLKRADENFFAAHLMNHILGGGTFSSRLFEEVREKRGLAYGVSSGLVTSKHTAYLVASTQTRAENQAEALQLMKDEINRMARDGVTKQELERAKKFVAGSYAIANLDTSAKIARVLVGLQTQDLGMDYIDERIALIEAVTLDDVNRMARELLSVEPSIVVVGSSENLQ